jgi:AmmeMemoRadiSam system protein B
MGTGHSILEGIYCLSNKDFSTPLGTTRNDRGAYEKLLAAADGAAAPNDFPHRKEHALEFQLIFLQRLLGAESFGWSHPRGTQHLTTKLPGFAREVGFSVYEALHEVIYEDGRRTLVVAGVDFSHIGSRFSHPIQLERDGGNQEPRPKPDRGIQKETQHSASKPPPEKI